MNPNSIRGMQDRVAGWVIRTFGAPVLRDHEERGLRHAEEAIELAQVLGIDKDRMHLLIDRVYARPVGEVHQELAGSFVTLLAAAESCGIDMMCAALEEVRRIEAKDPEHFRTRNREKAAQGVGNYRDGGAR